MLAATLSASYGIYGPVYEWCENRPLQEGSEEYLDSEKYEIRHFQSDTEHSLAPVITRLNDIRKKLPPLGWNHTLAFHPVDNDQILAYTKNGEGNENWVMVVVNLDPMKAQEGLLSFSLSGEQDLWVEDLMDGSQYQWSGGRHFVSLDPSDAHRLPFYVFQRIR